jgi:hypothetical protein
MNKEEVVAESVENTNTEDLNQLDDVNSNQQSEFNNLRKIKIRKAHKVDGVFETGLDVVEHEFDLETNGYVA